MHRHYTYAGYKSELPRARECGRFGNSLCRAGRIEWARFTMRARGRAVNAVSPSLACLLACACGTARSH